jgi:hypothetical protein
MKPNIILVQKYDEIKGADPSSTILYGVDPDPAVLRGIFPPSTPKLCREIIGKAGVPFIT